MKIIVNVTIPVFKNEKGTAPEGTMVIHRLHQVKEQQVAFLINLKT